MGNAADILKMIEAVDPSDAAMMDEIDARVWYWLNDAKDNEHGQIFINHSLWAVQKAGIKSVNLFRGDGWKEVGEWFICGKYQLFTRSRDALKAIRPEGWRIKIFQYDESPFFSAELRKEMSLPDGVRGLHGGMIEFSRCCKSEELAELHAVIKAIEHERKST